MRVASIDIGTNTVLLLIAERDERGNLVPLVERAEITRLGQGVDRSRTLAPDAVERTLDCLARYAREIRDQGVAAVDIVGTSAMRDAAGHGGGPNDFIRRAGEVLGLEPRVISGEEEATLAFAGGVHGLALRGNITAFDVGGGSTELISGNVDDIRVEVSQRRSLNVGSVRLFERHVHSDPPSAMELSVVRTFVLDQLLPVAPPAPGQALVGMAGTVTTLAAIARAVDPYDPSVVHGMHLPVAEIAETARRLIAMPLAERRSVTGLEPKRADVIPVGAIIVETILQWSSARELIVSDRGVRWGLALALAQRGT